MRHFIRPGGLVGAEVDLKSLGPGLNQNEAGKRRIVDKNPHLDRGAEDGKD